MSKVRVCGRCVLLVGLALAVAGVSAAQDGTKLRLKFTKGQKLTYVVDQKMVMKMNVQGMDVTMNMKMKSVVSQQVNDVDQDGKANITFKMQSIAMKMDGLPGVKIDYDSDNKNNPDDAVGKQINGIFDAMVGAEFKAVQSPEGKISDMKIPKDVSEALKKAAGGAPGLGEMFSGDNLQKMMGQGVSLPAKAVSKGDTWEEKLDIKTPAGKMETVNTFKYEGPTEKGGKKLEKIGLSVKTNVLPDPGAIVNTKVKDQKTTGEILFDNHAGRLIETNLTQNLQMELGVAGMTINQNIETTTSMKLRGTGK